MKRVLIAVGLVAVLVVSLFALPLVASAASPSLPDLGFENGMGPWVVTANQHGVAWIMGDEYVPGPPQGFGSRMLRIGANGNQPTGTTSVRASFIAPADEIYVVFRHVSYDNFEGG